MARTVKLILLTASIFVSLPFCASAQQAQSGGTSGTTTSGMSTTSAGSIFQSQIGGGVAPPSTGPNLPPVPTFNAINSAPSRTILTPSGATRGASNSTNIVCDFTDFSGAYGNVVDVCQ